MRMFTLLAIFTMLLALLTTLPFLRHSHWIIRDMDFPRLQFATLAVVLIVAELLLLDIRALSTQLLLLVAVLCLATQLWWILPYTPVWPKEVKSSAESAVERQFSILVSNVLTPNRNADALIALVKQHQPDVLVTLETDKWWEQQLEVLEDEMPHTVKSPLDNLYGMHVYSRLPLGEEEIRFFVEDDVPSIHATIELRTGDKIRAHFLHPAPPSPTENTESAERDAELVIVARSVAESDQPVIVTGDLNDVSWSATTRLFRKISGLLDPRVGRGMYNTFHAGYPLLRWPLDHLFHSDHFTVKEIKRLPSIDSDHFPVLTRLSFTPRQRINQEGLQEKANDRDWAREIEKEKGVSAEDVPEPGEE